MAGNASLKEEFMKASEDVQNLKKRPSNDDLLQLYALYKTATEGEVKGSRPGMLDIKGRAKYDAWAKMKGKSDEEAMKDYIQLVTQLKKSH